MAAGDRVATVPDRMAAHWRAAIVPLLNLFLAMHRILSEHEGMSPSVMLIYVTVCVGNIQKLMRERSVPADYTATAVLPREWVVPMSRSAIAAATGLPRETVRRHVAHLIDARLADRGSARRRDDRPRRDPGPRVRAVAGKAAHRIRAHQRGVAARRRDRGDERRSAGGAAAAWVLPWRASPSTCSRTARGTAAGRPSRSRGRRGRPAGSRSVAPSPRR